VNLVYQNFAKQQKDRILNEHPEIQVFVSKLERKIVNNPERGVPDSVTTTNGRSIPCYKQAIALDFFSERHAFGYGRLAVVYIYNSKSVAILRLYYSVRPNLRHLVNVCRSQ
jgi:hypothetical protein